MPIGVDRANLRTCVLDMDGVLWTMDDPVPGAAEAVARLKALGLVVSYLTNNSSKTRTDYVRKLAGFGIEAVEADVMTSAYATALLLRREGFEGARAYVIGEQGLRDELAAAGMECVDAPDQADVALVIVGWDRAFSYAKLAAAHGYLVRGGAHFIATNRDATYPDAGGRTLPGGGSIVAAVATAAAIEPRTVGKPEPHALRLLLDRGGFTMDQCLVIGDRLDTDIALGRRWGAPAAMVLTGISTQADVDACPEALRPDIVAQDLPALVRRLEAPDHGQ